MTPAQIRRLLENAKARAERLRGELATAEREVALFEELLKLHEADSHRVLELHTESESATLKHMQPELSAKRIGRPITSKHPFPSRCIEMGISVKAAAKKLGVHPNTLRSWYAEEPDGRPIPEEKKALLSKEPWNIPVRSWRKR